MDLIDYKQYFLTEAPASRPSSEDSIKKNLIGINQYYYDKRDVQDRAGKRFIRPGSVPKYMRDEKGKLVPFNPKKHGMPKMPANPKAPITSLFSLNDKQLQFIAKRTNVKFASELNQILNTISRGKANKSQINTFYSKYGLTKGKKPRGWQIYADPKLTGNRKPISEDPTNITKDIIETLEKGVPLPVKGNSSISAGTVSDLITLKVFSSIHGEDPKPEVIFDEKTGNVKSIQIGDITLKKNNITPEVIDKLKNRLKNTISDEEIQRKISELVDMNYLYQKQLDMISSLYDKKTGTFNATIIANTGGSSVRIVGDISSALASMKGVSPERKQKVTDILEKMTHISGDVGSQFNVLHEELIKSVLSKKDNLYASVSYLSESLSILRQSLLKKTIIIPKSESFKVADFIAIDKRSSVKITDKIEDLGLIDVNIDFASVKRKSGAASAQSTKIELSSFSSKKFSSIEIRNDLNTLTGVKAGQRYDDLFGNSPNYSKVQKENDKIWNKYADTILNAYELFPTNTSEKRSALIRLREYFRAGAVPKIQNGKFKETHIIPRSIFKNKKMDKEAWHLYCESGFLADVIYNTNVSRQAFINEVHKDKGGIDISLGHAPIIAVSKFQPDKKLRLNKIGKLVPDSKFPSFVQNTKVSDIPGRV